MAKVIIAPNKYVQGYGELKRLKEHVENLGNSFLFLISESGIKRSGEALKNSFKDSDCMVKFEVFNGECSKKEIDRLSRVCRDNNINVIVGVGGGKILDTAKAVAYYEKMPVVIIPTIASTDAPCSALSVIYTDEGVFSEYLVLPKNPEVVLMDEEVISKAPSRLLISGMGDALATYFEARACLASNAGNLPGGKSTKAAFALAKLCYETLLEDGLKAKLAAENKACTKAVQNVIEANTYLSGIGFESAGLAGAHAIHNGFTVLNDCHHLYHGEKVAFGTITQLFLENAPVQEIEEVVSFCLEVGLPVTLEEMGVKEVSRENIYKVAEASCAEGETIFNMPFEVTTEDVYAAILAADAFGKLYK
ncbi:glycerol dehydrogenase [Clostridium sp. DL1XJH146]